MAISLGGFVISRLLAERAGVQDTNQLTRISLIGAVVGVTPVGIVVTNELARREADSETAVITPGGGGGTTGGGGSGGGTSGGGGGTTLVQVPDFRNQTFDQAQRIANALGLSVRQVTAASNIQAIGQVIDQAPAAGSTVARGSTVTLIVSQGVQVPNLINSTSVDAQKTLAALGLGFQITNVRNAAAVGTVIDQNPAAGQMVSPRSSVSITVSQGPNITVPDVTKLLAADAEKTLRDAGFNVQQTQQPSGAINKGFVISQAPAAGTSGLPGDMVTITVSTGQGTALPDFSGQKADDAMAAIKKLGLNPLREDQNNDAVAANYVITQRPDAGKVLDPGSDVTLVVSLGADIKYAELPDFRGSTFADARELLQDTDLKVKRVNRDSDQAKEIVIDQDPPPGYVKPESTVTLFVSNGKGGVGGVGARGGGIPPK